MFSSWLLFLNFNDFKRGQSRPMLSRESLDRSLSEMTTSFNIESFLATSLNPL